MSQRLVLDFCIRTMRSTQSIVVLGLLYVLRVMKMVSSHSIESPCLGRTKHRTLTRGLCYRIVVLANAASTMLQEEDAPNYTKGFYVHTRLVLEDLLTSYPNCLNLRPIYPTTSLPNTKSLISKLLNFKKIVAVPTSISVMDDLWPLIIPMCEQNVTGTFNFTNPGVIDNNQIMLLYKKHVDSTQHWDLASDDELNQILALGRPAAEMDVSKLQKLFPYIPDVHTAVENMMIRIAKRNQDEAAKKAVTNDA